MCDPSALKKLPNPPRVVPPPADGVDGFVVVEAEPLESGELKNARELWYPLLPPAPPLRHAGEAGLSGAPPSNRWHLSLGIIE
jgi:hypothetical protein